MAEQQRNTTWDNCWAPIGRAEMRCAATSTTVRMGCSHQKARSPMPEVKQWTLLPRQSRDSVFGSVRQNFTEAVSAYSEFLYSDRTADIVETVLGPGGGSFYVDDTTTQFALSSGVSAKLA